MATEALTVVDVPVEELRENPENPRRITDPRFDALRRSLAADPDMMRARPLIALPDGTVIAGNMRLRAARELGWQTVPTVYADLDHERARLWLLRDNNPYGDWNEPDLGRMIAELTAGGADLELTGFDPDELDRLIEELGGGDGAPDRATDLALADVSIGDPVHAVERGETWRVGEHVLVVAGVYDGWPEWTPHLTGEALFVPYPTPTLPLTQRANRQRLVLVQPDPWLAGHLLDKFAAVRGEDELELL